MTQTYFERTQHIRCVKKHTGKDFLTMSNINASSSCDRGKVCDYCWFIQLFFKLCMTVWVFFHCCLLCLVQCREYIRKNGGVFQIEVEHSCDALPTLIVVDTINGHSVVKVSQLSSRETKRLSCKLFQGKNCLARSWKQVYLAKFIQVEKK